MEVRKKINELPPIDKDPRFVKLVRDYKCKHRILVNEI
jgi:hypothetical protein